MNNCVYLLRVEELKAAAGQNGAKKREAVYDKGDGAVGRSSASYVPKVCTVCSVCMFVSFSGRFH